MAFLRSELSRHRTDTKAHSDQSFQKHQRNRTNLEQAVWGARTLCSKINWKTLWTRWSLQLETENNQSGDRQGISRPKKLPVLLSKHPSTSVHQQTKGREQPFPALFQNNVGIGPHTYIVYQHHLSTVHPSFGWLDKTLPQTTHSKRTTCTRLITKNLPSHPPGCKSSVHCCTNNHLSQNLNRKWWQL